MYTVGRYPTLPKEEIERRMAQRKLDKAFDEARTKKEIIHVKSEETK